MPLDSGQNLCLAARCVALTSFVAGNAFWQLGVLTGKRAGLAGCNLQGVEDEVDHAARMLLAGTGMSMWGWTLVLWHQPQCSMPWLTLRLAQLDLESCMLGTSTNPGGRGDARL